MKVLVALDASATSTAIIREIALRRWSAETSICVLYVVNETAFSSDFVDVESYVHVENEAALALVKNAARFFQRHGFQTSAMILKGRPAKVIVEYAKKWGADLIVLGASRNSGGLAARFLGNVAKSVLRHAPCSVEIIKTTNVGTTEEKDRLRILLATDGSSCSLAAARAVAAREWPPETQFKVVSAMPESVAEIEPLRGLSFTGAELREQEYLIEPAQVAVALTQKIIEDAGLSVSAELLVGNPVGVILEHAREWGADLIVVGSHGRHGLERMFEGSVSEAVVTQAPCSVAVIHETPRP